MFNSSVFFSKVASVWKTKCLETLKKSPSTLSPDFGVLKPVVDPPWCLNIAIGSALPSPYVRPISSRHWNVSASTKPQSAKGTNCQTTSLGSWCSVVTKPVLNRGLTHNLPPTVKNPHLQFYIFNEMYWPLGLAVETHVFLNFRKILHEIIEPQISEIYEFCFIRLLVVEKSRHSVTKIGLWWLVN